MFVDDFDEQKFVVLVYLKVVVVDDSRFQYGVGGKNIEGDDKDGYYKIWFGEFFDGCYQVFIIFGCGMFLGVVCVVDVINK